MNPTNIRIWIHEKDLSSLERVVWEGFGHLLLNQTSANIKIKKLLEATPRLMVNKATCSSVCVDNKPIWLQNEIKDVHESAVYGDLDSIAGEEFRQSVYLAKDVHGIPAFHKVRTVYWVILIPKWS